MIVGVILVALLAGFIVGFLSAIACYPDKEAIIERLDRIRRERET